MQFIDLKEQYRYLKTSIEKRISKVLDHGQYIMGPEVHELEGQLAEYVGVKHAISCANGTDALQLALMAIGASKPNQAIFCPTFTFFASAEAISFVGATPVFVDSEPDTFNICSSDLEKQINNVLREGELTPFAIMAVDLFGLPADYEKIRMISDKYGLLLIEDAAQGFGGSLSGRKAGSFGDISTTSFFPAKPLGCYGDGGALFTDNDDYAELLRSYRVHGKGIDKYDNIRIGMNSRLDTIQAAVLLEKLKVFPSELKARQSVAERYNQSLMGIFETPKPIVNYNSSWAQYTLKSNHRDNIISGLQRHGIPSNVYYRKCMHQQSAFLSNREDNYSHNTAENLAATVFSLPMHPYLTKKNIEQVCSALIELYPECINGN